MKEPKKPAPKPDQYIRVQVNEAETRISGEEEHGKLVRGLREADTVNIIRK